MWLARRAKYVKDMGAKMVAQMGLIEKETKADMDKSKALDAALSQIERAFGKGFGDEIGGARRN